MSGNRGFTYGRTLMALLITLTILPLAISIFSFVANIKPNYNLLNNELALIDLRRRLLIAYDLNIEENRLEFINNGETNYLYYVNDKLILSPGTQIYLNDVKDVYFNLENGVIYLNYITNDNKEYKSAIGKEKGFYIDDFLDNND
jgi:hypothetical protein